MKKLNKTELIEFLNEKAELYETPSFLDTDPIHIPASFTLKQDVEIAGFLTATIAWGNRKSIINNAKKLMEIMGQTPYDFVMEYNSNKHYEYIEGFVHRTFNSIDLDYFVKALQHLNCFLKLDYRLVGLEYRSKPTLLLNFLSLVVVLY